MIDDRILRLGIEISGSIRTYEKLDIVASGSKFSNSIQNEFSINIVNLSKDTREQILSETNILDRNVNRPKVFLYAGRKSYEPSLIFKGDIRMTTVTQPPDIAVNIKTYTGDTQKLKTTVRSTTNLILLSQLSKDIATSLEKELIFEATDKQISNYSFSGSSLRELEKLEEAADVDAYIDDDRLIVKNKEQPLNNRIIVVSKDTGMIGIPELNERGVRVKVLFSPNFEIGVGIDLRSTINPTASGIYTIYKMTYDLSNRDQSFYITLECTRRNQ